MRLDEDHLSASMIDETLRFASSSVGATAAIFCWIDPQERISGFETTGVSSELMDLYLDGRYVHDPLNVYELIENRYRLAFLDKERGRRSYEENRVHDTFLCNYDIRDEVDLLFWQGDKPFAMLAMLSARRSAPFTELSLNWEAMRAYLEFNLQMHPRVRRAKQEAVLAGRFGLTRREIEVVDLLKSGASNLTIAQIMGIGLATVKTYVINILNKLGVDNRAAIVAFLERMPLS
jgi:DNA-binding CsgD family transcriptional regulator